MIVKRLAALRREMEKRGIAIYIVPTADFHNSEYVGTHFKAREYMTGFTGSAGTAVITMTEAGLWTDARYFVQAGMQLEGSPVTLYRMGEEDVPEVKEYIEDMLKEGECIGFDGRVVSGSFGDELKAIADKKHGSLYVDEDLVDLIWKNRPPLSAEPVELIDLKYVGESTVTKLRKVREKMEEEEADVHLVSSLYDIAWILNIRGDDIAYVPVVLSYLAIGLNSCTWFAQEEALSDEILAYMDVNDILVRPYESFYEYIKSLGGKKVLLNKKVLNYRACNNVPASVKIIDKPDPSELLKAVKNNVEVDNTREAHVKDGVAMCKFMYWLKKNVGEIPMTEISVSNYLASLRAKQEGFLELSFETICGYADHGAIVHYEATEETDAQIRPEGLLLVDSGGHYYEGTTDITRTFVLGPVTEEMKANFTRVCRSNLNLASVRFLQGCSGLNLDIVAREPFWEANLDFKHGTGHGVGYLLNVHEGPNNFNWKKYEDSGDDALMPGMITTDEPGIYIEGEYGIRLENELVCRRGEKNEYGQFLYFENITYVPFDLDGIDPEQMTIAERGRLNDYHANVYRVIAPYLKGEELKWLKEATREI
ncbi:MAG: aminopeptidase P family protein [Muribaculaceae bacterium]|nr:aminopeptidase P family protein [Roseburia sp.]MCM1432107.1 aminopeptidase P family protein [Muribaculaceae bacterium]MCM1493974.1 aminopeptidase P family protein [Muribaculaceae bacterium]